MNYKKEAMKFKELAKDDAEVFVFDMETTGLKAETCDAIEFSALRVRVTGDSYEVLEKRDIYINPGYHIPEEITNLTGIDDERVKDAPSSIEAAEMIYQMMGPYPILIGYNSISFDMKFLSKLYASIGKSIEPVFHLDVLRMAKDLAPKPHKLINMAELAGVAEGLSFHTSIDDAIATLEVMKYLLPQYDSIVEPDMADFKVNSVKRWKKSHVLDRLYVANNLNISAYYDIPRKEWNTEKADSDVVKAAVYDFMAVKTDEEFLKLVSGL